MSRKVAVLTAISKGSLTMTDACHRYGISPEEIISWQAAVTHFGPEGLYATRRFRQTHSS
jgi:hypothetical protein